MTKSTGNTTGHILDIENVKENVEYTMTIAPSDDHQYWNEEDRVEKFRIYFRNYMVKKLLPNKFKFYIEVSPHGRLHLHGTISFKNLQTIKKFYIDDVRFLTLHNQIEIDTIEDKTKWETYVTKQSKFNFGSINSEEYDKIKDNPVKFKKIPMC